MDLTALIVRRLCPVIVCLLVLNYSSFCELWSFIRSILCISWFIVICFPHQKNPKNIKRAKMWKSVFFIFNVVSQCSEWGDRKTLLLHLRCRDSHVTPAKVEVRNASHGCVTGSAMRTGVPHQRKHDDDVTCHSKQGPRSDVLMW